jgi:AraC-like DNA-binding protein
MTQTELDPVATPPATDPHGERLAELVRLALAFAPTDGLHETPIGPLHIIRASAPAQPLPAVYEPGLCLVVQGRKHARLGSDLIVYDPLHYLLISVTMLPVGQVVEATPERPYLCLRLNIDPREIGALLLERPLPQAPDEEAAPQRGLRVARVSFELLDAMTRLMRLLKTPEHAPVLSPLLQREILYRVLTGEMGSRLRSLAVADSHAQRIARAIELIKHRYAQPLRIDDVAGAVHMSASTLHHHFKQVTSMSPLQFQKHLRLHHARRLMLTEGLDAAGAGHRVGYESPSQFSREYRRLFGAPPRSEIQQVRSAVQG